MNQASQVFLALATQSEQHSLTVVPEAVQGSKPEFPLSYTSAPGPSTHPR